METATLLFLHGFASSAQGTKAHYLRERLAGQADVAFAALDFNPTPRDFEYLTTSGMINRLRQYLLDRALAGPDSPLYLVGSSMGGLVALNYAHRFGGVAGLLLLAPALTYRFRGHSAAGAGWEEGKGGEVYHYAFERALFLRHDVDVDGQRYREAPPPPAPVVIIHGRQDQVVPFAESRAYAERYPRQVHLVAVDASHAGLNEHLELIWQETLSLLSG